MTLTCTCNEPECRMVLCDECGSEGRIYVRSPCNPYEEIDRGPCERCEGTGWMIVEVEPITLQDLEPTQPDPTP